MSGEQARLPGLTDNDVLEAFRLGFLGHLEREETSCVWLSQDGRYLYCYDPLDGPSIDQFGDDERTLSRLSAMREWRVLRFGTIDSVTGMQDLTHYVFGEGYDGATYGLVSVAQHEVEPLAGLSDEERTAWLFWLNGDIAWMRISGLDTPDDNDRSEFEQAIRDLIADTEAKRSTD